jgi:hypothetical protein
MLKFSSGHTFEERINFFEIYPVNFLSDQLNNYSGSFCASVETLIIFNFFYVNLQGLLRYDFEQ